MAGSFYAVSLETGRTIFDGDAPVAAARLEKACCIKGYRR